MNDIRIEPGDDLRAVVFKVCTALMRGGGTPFFQPVSTGLCFQQSTPVDGDMAIARLAWAGYRRQARVDCWGSPSGRSLS